MSNTPSVSIAFSNGNLLQNIAAIDGQVAFIGSGHTGGNIGTVFVINSLSDAETQGLTAIAEPAAHRHLKEFYTELAGNQQIYVLLLANTVTMAAMLDTTVATAINKLILAGEGKIGLVGVFREPDGAYDGGDDFFDSGVATALTAAKTAGQYWNGKNYFFRTLIEGRVMDASSATIFAPNTATNGWAAVVLGGTLADGSASVGIALGRAVKYAAHIKVGKVANGSLSATAIYIGAKLLKEVANLDALHGKGVISFVTYPNKAGFYFGIDNMASADDYKLLANGRVIDAAAKVALAVYLNELESEVDTNADGTIKELDALDLEARINQQVKVTLGDRISGFTSLVNRSINIVNTSTTAIKLRVQPKGYLTFIDVDLGFTAGN